VGSLGMGGGCKAMSGGVSKISKRLAEVMGQSETSQCACVPASRSPALVAGPEPLEVVIGWSR